MADKTETGCAIFAFLLWLVAFALSLALPVTVIYVLLKLAGTL